MEYLRIGKIVNTHALKGEVRIISDFEYKDQVFVVPNKLYIGTFKVEETINTYRKHKNYDMITFVGKNYINDVINYKGEAVFVLKDSIKLNDDEVLFEDLVNMTCLFEDKDLGKVQDYRNDNGNRLLLINDKYIPYNKEFIEKIDKKNNTIYFKNIGGLL